MLPSKVLAVLAVKARLIVIEVIAAVTLVGCLSGCSINDPSLKGIPPGDGRLAGHVTPGTPPNGTVPTMILTFSNGSSTVQATVTKGAYQVDLPAGVWSVRSQGGVCATGISVHVGAWQRDDLGFPIVGCQDLSGPPVPSTPAPPLPR